jgi:hypothetical protein
MEKISRRDALIRLGIAAGGVAVLTAPNRRVLAAGSKDSAHKFERPLTAITLGAGSRGTLYGEYATEYPRKSWHVVWRVRDRVSTGTRYCRSCGTHSGTQ